MTKMIKMSLMAAVAVVGTTASAQSLEDAIKNVDVSGYVDYRLENKSKDNATGADKATSVNEYGVNVTLTSKVNDMVKATVSAGLDEVTTANDNTGSAITPSVAQDSSSKATIAVDKAYFTFALPGATVIAGKQAIPSAFVDKVDTVKTGAGVVALVPVNDMLTIAAAHFMNNNIGDVGSVYGSSATAASDMVGAGAKVSATDTKTTELIAMGKIANVDYAVHYNMTDIAALFGGTEADHMFVKVGADVSGVKLGFKHATASADSANGQKWNDSSVTALSASAKVAAASVNATYFTADKSGTGFNTDVALDGDNDADVHVKVWQLSTAAISNEGSGFALGASMPVIDNLTVGLTYAVATDEKADSAGKDLDYSEILAMVTYKMSKNLTLHARYSMLEADGSTDADDYDQAYSRLAIRYTF